MKYWKELSKKGKIAVVVGAVVIVVVIAVLVILPWMDEIIATRASSRREVDTFASQFRLAA